MPRTGRTRPGHLTPVTGWFLTVPIVSLLPAVALTSGASSTWIIETSLVVATVGHLIAYFLVSVSTPVSLWRLGDLTLRRAGGSRRRNGAGQHSGLPCRGRMSAQPCRHPSCSLQLRQAPCHRADQ